jgi:hypothetical protein
MLCQVNFVLVQDWVRLAPLPDFSVGLGGNKTDILKQLSESSDNTDELWSLQKGVVII